MYFGSSPRERDLSFFVEPVGTPWNLLAPQVCLSTAWGGRVGGYRRWLLASWKLNGPELRTWTAKEKGIGRHINDAFVCFMNSLLTTVVASQVSFELVFSLEVTWYRPHPKIQHSAQEAELSSGGKWTCRLWLRHVWMFGWRREDFVVWKELYREGTRLKIFPLCTR